MERKKIIVQNEPEQLLRIHATIEQIGNEWKLDPDLLFRLNLVLEEYVDNLISYGYTDKLPHEITLELIKDGNVMEVRVSDDGNPFNILDIPENKEIDKPLEERSIGGLGIHFIKSFTDDISYSTSEGINTLNLSIRLND